MNTSLGDRDFVEKNMKSQGRVPMSYTPEEMASLMQRETARMAGIVKRSGAKMD